MDDIASTGHPDALWKEDGWSQHGGVCCASMVNDVTRSSKLLSDAEVDLKLQDDQLPTRHAVACAHVYDHITSMWRYMF